MFFLSILRGGNPKVGRGVDKFLLVCYVDVVVKGNALCLGLLGYGAFLFWWVASLDFKGELYLHGVTS